MMPRQLNANLIHYLKQVSAMMPKRPGYKYRGFEGFYLAKGHQYPHAPYTEAEAKAIVNGIAETSFVPAIKQCFFNAQKLAALGGFGYAEGYVLTDDLPIPIHHAWAVYHGKPVDVTIRRGEDKMTKDPVKLLVRASQNVVRAAYYGVEFQKAKFLAVWHEEGTARAMVDDWKHGFPLLRG